MAQYMPGMNGMNGMMPGYNGMMPGYNNMNGMMPGTNGMMPGYNGMMPGYNGMMPGYNNMNGMMPGTNGMMACRGQGRRMTGSMCMRDNECCSMSCNNSRCSINMGMDEAPADEASQK
ncbi:hypothetical protein V1264_009383 [Littorina saxatilis]